MHKIVGVRPFSLFLLFSFSLLFSGLGLFHFYSFSLFLFSYFLFFSFFLFFFCFLFFFFIHGFSTERARLAGGASLHPAKVHTASAQNVQD